MASDSYRPINYQINKIYIGQLPLDITEEQVRGVFSHINHLITEIKLIKSDGRGQFQRFCYGFITVKAPENDCREAIRSAQTLNTGWKINMKNQNSTNSQRFRDDTRDQMRPVQPQIPKTVEAPPIIEGIKKLHIVVREIWIGGIPEDCEKTQLTVIMGHFGIVENVETFPRFAFVKFKAALEATIAFERAENIYTMMGKPPGFRITFSDPARRANVVSNHYDFEKDAPYLPILFLGFPPNTSARIEMEPMRQICSAFGPITDCFMRKNTSSQTRSYFLFYYETMKDAIRAKIELSRRKELLNEKRAEVTLLLSEDAVMKGRDFSYTLRNFQSEPSFFDRRQQGQRIPPPNFQPQYPPQAMQMMAPRIYPPYNKMVPPPPYPGYYPMPGQHGQHGQHEEGYPPPNMPHYMQPSPYYQPIVPHPMYGRPYEYDQQSGNPLHRQHNGPMPDNMHRMPPPLEPNYPPQQNPLPPRRNELPSADMMQLLNNVLDDRSSKEQNEKKPIKKPSPERGENIPALVESLLGGPERSPSGPDVQPVWSGFIYWRGQKKRCGVDGFGDLTEPEVSGINLTYQIAPDNVVFSEEQFMILRPTNSTCDASFKECIEYLKDRVGVGLYEGLFVYVIPRSKLSDKIAQIKCDELLAVFEKNSLMKSIRDSLIKFQTD